MKVNVKEVDIFKKMGNDDGDIFEEWLYIIPIIFPIF